MFGSNKKANRAALRVEGLEGRDVPAVGITQVGDVVRIDGTAGRDTITVAYEPGSLPERVKVTSQTDGGEVQEQTVQLSRLVRAGWGYTAQRLVNAVEVYGAAGSDTIDLRGVPTFLSVRADGGAGSDAITGPAAAAVLIGGDGRDNITAGAGNDTIEGAAGADTIDAGTGNNTVLGGDGHDTITAGGGNDYIQGDDGDDTIDAGAGNDAVYGDGPEVEYVDVRLSAGPGRWYTSRVRLGGYDDITGGAGNDWIAPGPGGSKVDAGAGDDRVMCDVGDDLVFAGDGNDYAEGYWGDDTLFGGAGNDELHGGNGEDVVNGGAGNDLLLGDDGNDVVGAYVGGSFKDGVGKEFSFEHLNNEATDGKFKFYGVKYTDDAGNDTMYGGNGDDMVRGGAGNDQVYGQAGSDELGAIVVLTNAVTNSTGSTLQDLIGGSDGTSSDGFDDRTSYHWEVLGEDGNDVLYGDTGNDLIRGGDGNDTLDGGSGDDHLGATDRVTYDGEYSTLITSVGEDGNDVLHGQEGDDVLKGGLGSDEMHGDRGNDHLYNGWKDGHYDNSSDDFVGGAGVDIYHDFDVNDNLYD